MENIGICKNCSKSYCKRYHISWGEFCSLECLKVYNHYKAITIYKTYQLKDPKA